MAVGAYPATRADLENPQVRKGEKDETVVRMFDEHQAAVVNLDAVVEQYGLAAQFEEAGLTQWSRQHKDVWKDEHGDRQWKLTQIEVNPHPKERHHDKSGAYFVFCFLSLARSVVVVVVVVVGRSCCWPLLMLLQRAIVTGADERRWASQCWWWRR